MNLNDLSFRYPDRLVPILGVGNTATVRSKVQCPTSHSAAVASQGAQRPHGTFGSRVSGAADAIIDHSIQRHTHMLYTAILGIHMYSLIYLSIHPCKYNLSM